MLHKANVVIDSKQLREKSASLQPRNFHHYRTENKNFPVLDVLFLNIIYVNKIDLQFCASIYNKMILGTIEDRFKEY